MARRASAAAWPPRAAMRRRRAAELGQRVGGRRRRSGTRGRTSRNVLPSPGCALDRDLAAEQSRQLARNRQAEAGAAELAVGRAVGLAERLEDDLLVLGGDADAGVAHRERHEFALRRGRISSATSPRSVNLSAFDSRFLQDLRQALRVGVDGRGQVRRLDARGSKICFCSAIGSNVCASRATSSSMSTLLARARRSCAPRSSTGRGCR